MISHMIPNGHHSTTEMNNITLHKHKRLNQHNH